MNPRNRPARTVLAATLAAAFLLSGFARAEAELSAERRREVVDGLAELLDELYVIPETADAMIARLQGDLSAGRFDSLDEPSHFAATLTEILQEMSGDKHLRVSCGTGEAPGLDGPDPGGPVRIIRKGGGADPGEAADGEPRRVIRRVSGGEGDAGPKRIVRREPGSGDAPGMLDGIEPFPGVEMLPGNVGYLEVRLFAPRETAEEKAVQAMETIAGADAVIFDLRGCMGGSPDMVHLLTSYLYGPEPMHLLTYYHAHEDPDSAYTLAEVPGQRMQDVPVYIVTSAFTASGGEEFTHNLKHHGRATVVGETTAGAGHGGGVHVVAAGFTAFIPDFRPVHPVTGGGWEGVGVKPDLEVPAEKALAAAHREALREIARRHPERKEEVAGHIAQLEAEAERQAQPVDTAALAEYAGVYEIRTIRVKEDGLYFQRTGGPELLLVPAEEADSFTLELIPSARIRFERDDGTVSELHVRNMQGEWEVTKRAASADAR